MPVTRKMFLLHDVIMINIYHQKKLRKYDNHYLLWPTNKSMRFKTGLIKNANIVEANVFSNILSTTYIITNACMAELN